MPYQKQAFIEHEQLKINSRAMEHGLDVISILQSDKRLKTIMQERSLPEYLIPFVDSVKHGLYL